MKIIRRLFRIIFFTVLILFAGGIILSHFYKEKIIDFLVNELNKQLTTQIEVEEIKFSLIRKFPNASLEFKNVLIRSTSQFDFKESHQINTDTLLCVKHLFLQFNLRDIVKSDITVKTIHAENGTLKLYTTKDGLVNYRFWKTKQDTGQSNFTLALQDLKFSNIELTLIDKANRVDLKGYINKFAIRGHFASFQYSLKTQGNIFVQHLEISNAQILRNRPVKLELNLDVEDNKHNLHKGGLDISGLEFDVTGTFFTKKDKRLQLVIRGKDLDVSDLVPLFPTRTRDKLKKYNPRGKISFQSAISGSYGPGGSIHIEIGFGVQDGFITKEDSKIKLSDLKLEGFYSNGEKNSSQSSKLEVSKFNTLIGRSELAGSYTIIDFKNPIVELLLTGDINMQDIKEFFDIDTLQYLTGEIRANVKLEGRIQNINKISIRDLERLNPVGHILYKDVGFKLQGAVLDFSGINGSMMLGKHFWLDGIFLNISGNELLLEGKLGNAMPYLISGTKPLLIEGTIKADKLDFEKFIKKSGNKSQYSDSSIIKFPDKLQAKLNFDIGHFTFRRFSANNCKGLLTYKPHMAVVNSLSLESMEGEISGNGIIIRKYNGDFSVKTQVQLNEINIRDMFYSFNNFGQKFIMDNHVKGILAGNISFSSEITPGLKIKKEKVITESSLVINNGELIEFEPMLGLSRFIELSELKHITFSTLENEIFIKDETVTIPLMDIYSTAFNISLSGVHHFSNKYNYKVRVLLSEVLARKAREVKKENEEFGIIEDDDLGHTSLYLSIAGDKENIHISYDKDQVKNVIKETIKEERNELKKMLQEEFGWFRKDSSLREFVDEQQKFVIEWEEVDTIQIKKPEKKKTSRKFIIEWEEEDTTRVKKKRNL